MIEGLGQFEQGFASWHKAMACGTDPTARMVIFTNAARDVAGFVSKGLDLALAADGLQEMAESHGLVAEFGADVVQAHIARAFEHIEEREHVPDLEDEEDEEPPRKPNGKHGPATPAIEPTLYVLPDEASIPKRIWLYGYHYMRGVVTATVAPGGFGKTTLALHEAMEMACKLGLRVWFISGEDDRVEIDRRIAAYAHGQGITNETLAGRLYVDDKLSFPFKIAKASRSGVEFDQQAIVGFESAVQRRQIDVVIIDPFISFHYLSENDTGAMDALIKRLAEVCQRQQCCIELCHHVRKPTFGQTEITVYDARGAAAIVNAVRSCRVLNHMSQDEADRAGVSDDDRVRYVRIDSGKRNMAPPEKARWGELLSVQLANGDNVQALVDYEFKTVGITSDDTDWLKIVVKAKPYRTYSQSPDWLGHPIATRFRRDPQKKSDAIWITQQIKRWERDGIISQVEWLDEQRKKRQFYVLTEDKDKFDLTKQENEKAPKLRLVEDDDH